MDSESQCSSQTSPDGALARIIRYDISNVFCDSSPSPADYGACTVATKLKVIARVEKKQRAAPSYGSYHGCIMRETTMARRQRYLNL